MSSKSHRFLKDQWQKSNGKKDIGTESVIGKLREVEVLISQGQTIPTASRAIGVTEQTYYRWRKAYGGRSGVSVSGCAL